MDAYVIVTNGVTSRWRKFTSLDEAVAEQAWLQKLVAAKVLFGEVAILECVPPAEEEDPVAQFERQESM